MIAKLLTSAPCSTGFYQIVTCQGWRVAEGGETQHTKSWFWSWEQRAESLWLPLLWRFWWYFHRPVVFLHKKYSPSWKAMVPLFKQTRVKPQSTSIIINQTRRCQVRRSGVVFAYGVQWSGVVESFVWFAHSVVPEENKQVADSWKRSG